MHGETGRLWYLPELPGVELLSGSYCQQVFPWHFHDTYCLSLQEQGSETIAFAGQVLRVPAGQLLIINPGEAHSNYAHQPRQAWHFRSFYLPVALLQALAGPGAPPPYFPAKLLADPALFRQLRQVHQRLELAGYSPQAQADLEQSLATLVRRYARPARPPATPALERLPQVLALLGQQLPHKVAVADLAAEAGLSRFHFTRRFAQATGLTPIAYLTQQRVGAAKLLLQAGAPPVVAALETGFFDQSHFARAFKRWVGTTPGHYRAPDRTIVQER